MARPNKQFAKLLKRVTHPSVITKGAIAGAIVAAIILTFQWSAESQSTEAAGTYRVRVTSNIAYGPDPAHKLDLCAPITNRTNIPAVILIHGGGWVQGDKQQMLNLCKQFASNGIIGVTINYRLLNTATIPATNTYPTPAADAQLASRWLRANAGIYKINPDALCAFGRSAGSHLAMLLGTLRTIEPSDMESLYADKSPRVSCVVDEYGPTDLMLYAQSQDVDRWKAMGNYAAKGDAGMIEASPLYKVSADTVPMMIVHGEQDTNIIIQHSISMRDALQASGVRVQYISYPNASHGLPELTSEERIALLNSEIEFVASIIGRI